MTNAINTNADAITADAATDSSSSFTTDLNWKRSAGIIRPTVYGSAFVIVNFLLITAVSYDYALASVA